MYRELHKYVDNFYKLSSNISTNISDAIQHFKISVDIPDDFTISTDMFDISYNPSFNFRNTNDDYGSWPEWSSGELLSMTQSDKNDEISIFRGKQWAKRAKQWLKDKFPHIVIINAGNFYEISDGRGRVSLAIGLGLSSLPAIIMSLKNPNNITDLNLRNKIQELIQMINSVYTP